MRAPRVGNRQLSGLLVVADDHADVSGLRVIGPIFGRFARGLERRSPRAGLRHSFARPHPRVGRGVELRRAEHGPHDGQTLVDELGHALGREFDRRTVHPAPRRRDRIAHRPSDVIGRSPAAGPRSAGHGQHIHVGRNPHVAHNALPCGRNAVTFRSLVHHGHIAKDHVAVGAALDARAQAFLNCGVGDTRLAAAIGRGGRNDTQGNIFTAWRREEKGVPFPVPAQHLLARLPSLAQSGGGGAAKQPGERGFQSLRIRLDRFAVFPQVRASHRDLAVIQGSGLVRNSIAFVGENHGKARRLAAIGEKGLRVRPRAEKARLRRRIRTETRLIRSAGFFRQLQPRGNRIRLVVPQIVVDEKRRSAGRIDVLQGRLSKDNQRKESKKDRQYREHFALL